MKWTEIANAISSVAMTLTTLVAVIIAYREYKNSQRTEPISAIKNAKEAIKGSC